MSAWRRKALELVPELRAEIEDPKQTVGLFMIDVLGATELAHRADDEDLLRRLYEDPGSARRAYGCRELLKRYDQVHRTRFASR